MAGGSAKRPSEAGTAAASLGQSGTLVLVPTELELRRILDLGGFGAGCTGGTVVELCGFGPIAAAARTAWLLETLRPGRVLLVGIAGAYDVERDAVGSALEFATVAVDGIGVGEGASFLAPPALGFPQWPAPSSPPPGSPQREQASGAARLAHPIFDQLPLSASQAAGDALLLTTCAASANAEQAAVRRGRFPSARAEDMEGFAVATACALAGVPLRIVRGISNRAGDRAAERWSIPRALQAARALALELLDAEADDARGSERRGGRP
jgi:futalosine hydrolase